MVTLVKFLVFGERPIILFSGFKLIKTRGNSKPEALSFELASFVVR